MEKTKSPSLNYRDSFASDPQTYHDSDLSDAEASIELPAAAVEERPRRVILQDRKERDETSSDAYQSERSQARRIAQQNKSALETKPPKKTVQKTARKSSSHRALQVDELMLVRSPPRCTSKSPRPSSPVDVAAQDPITDYASSPPRHISSAVAHNDIRRQKRRVLFHISAHKTRLKAPKFAFKSIVRTKGRQYDLLGARGDGFDPRELRMRSILKIRRRRKLKYPSVLAFAKLKLRSGPLPDVEFHDSGVELDMIADNKDVAFNNISLEHANKTTESDDSAQERMIFAQLSSISAPKRPVSEYEEDEESNDYQPTESLGDDYCDDELGREHNDGDEISEAEEDLEPVCLSRPWRTPSVGAAPNSRQEKEYHPARAFPTNLEFDTPMEDEDPIMEVQPRAMRDHFIDPILETKDDLPLRRLRSILKNSTPIVPDNTTERNQTAANTRHNSFVSLEVSRYFNEAAALLDDVPGPRKHRIVPRRRSSYFADDCIEVPATEELIPETSPDRDNYITRSDLARLRIGSDALWTSSVPVFSKDLKSLTRAVSRENGTLSQAVRRRPSLPFQSPTKVR